MTPPVVVVGAGLAGLACALELHRAGVPVEVHEASNGVGGRVRTDVVDGFLLDRGFQIYLTAYPEGRRAFDHDRLDLRRFAPGAVVRVDGEFHRVGDPFRRPLETLATLRAPIGSPGDKLRIARLAAERRPWGDLPGPDERTIDHLQRLGFSDQAIDRFLRPLFSGILLDSDLQTSAAMMRFVFRMLATGDAVVPGGGMRALPDQLAGRLPSDAVHLESPVAEVHPDGVVAAGVDRPASAVVVATDGPAAARLTGIDDPGSRPVACVYFAAPRPPLRGPTLVLDGDDSGPIVNLAVISEVNPYSAPVGESLVAAACLNVADDLETRVRTQLTGWFGGAVVDEWRHLRTYRIEHAHPRVIPPVDALRPPRLESGVLVAGDHRATPSINGALLSGRRAADAVLAER